MPRNDQAVRLLVILKQLEGARHGLTLEQLADSLAPAPPAIPAPSAATWPPWKKRAIRW
ncbi:MAG: hypothetical protein AMXMBFR67_29930 [Nitrospira sp.]